MAGIYLHIPFCRKKCGYCNFFSLATKKFRDTFVEALLKETGLNVDYLDGETVDTIYFGGGTPSLFGVSELEKILNKIRDLYPAPAPPLKEKGVLRIPDPGTMEITLEMNPDDVTPEYLENLFSIGISRVSLGVQSFFDEDLEYLDRSHTAKQATHAIELILDSGYRMQDKRKKTKDERKKPETGNISVDLIYGIPTLTNRHWLENLQNAIGAGIPHVSAYALTVEQKTPLSWQIREGIKHPVSEDQASEQFEILMEVMEGAGYIHYEISNFCLPGFESRHNRNYWKGIHYLGLGPSAHSFNGTSRRWNIPNLTSYLRSVQSGNLLTEEEHLTVFQQYNEYVMTSLRTIWGCDVRKIRRVFGEDFERYFLNQAIRYQASDHLAESEGIFTLTRKGKFLADGIAADLFKELPE